MGIRSIIDLLHVNAQEVGSKVALKYKEGGTYQNMDWAELARRVKLLATVLLDKGVCFADRVCILSQTRLEWVICDLAIIQAGAVSVPVYPTNLADECGYILENSGAAWIFTENAEQTRKIVAIKESCKALKGLIQLTGELPAGCEGWASTLSELLAKTPRAKEEALAERVASLSKNSLLTLIYTSGTTGYPKGVMLTHGNMLYEADASIEVDLLRADDVQLLFLPLAHVLARVLEYTWLRSRHVLAFAEEIATIAQNLKEVSPTLMVGVPRIYEKFYVAICDKALKESPLKRAMFSWALRLNQAHADSYAAGKKLPPRQQLEFMLAKRLVFKKIARNLQAALGGKIRLLVSGGAPLSRKIAWFFQHAGLQIVEGYGLTETSAGTCVSEVGRIRIGEVGPPVPGTQVRLAADGELMIKGPGVMRGYWQNEAATGEVLRDGWFYTGDIAAISEDGVVRIVDRKKDIIITAGGKNVAPQNIESLIKGHKLISQVVVHGDQRNFLSAIVTLEASALADFAKEHHLEKLSYSELTRHKVVYEMVEAIIEAFNRQLPQYETIKKFSILDHDFSLEGGELTPSLKVKRKLINQRYQSIFDSFYEESYR